MFPIVNSYCRVVIVSQVIVDDEEVIFEGEMPKETSRVYQLLMEALSEQAKVIYTIEVDGKSPDGGELPEAYEKIVITSITHDELTMKLSIQSLNQMSDTGKHLDAYLKNVLSLPWSEVFKRMNEFIEKIQPFAELLDSIVPYATAYSPPWADDLQSVSKEQSRSLENILKSFEQGNPATLSDELAVVFLPLYNKTTSLFQKEIIPFLKKKVEAQE
jgi:hypothetical protein